MTLNEYQDIASTTDLQHPIEYYFAGLSEESGEVNGVFKRILRGDSDPGDLKKELGDVLWYLTEIADKFQWTLEDIATVNLDKLWNRKVSGTLKGKGDNR